MQDIIIKLNTEDKDLDTTIDKMVKLGLIDEKNAKQYKKNQTDHNNGQKKTIGLLENARNREKQLANAREKSTDPKKIKRLNNLMVKQRGHINKLTGATKKQTAQMSQLSSMVQNVGVAMLAAFSVQAVISFGKEVIATMGEFQRFEAVLTNTLGSESAAQSALAMITDFASETPFAVAELTESFVKLANQGFKPTKDELRSLGDLASSTGKGFDQLAEAIIDAQTGEFERLKEFGIRAEKQGDKVTFAFKGVKTQVDFTEESMRAYLLTLGDLEGVSGAMAAISETIEGRLSNLGDSYDQMILSIDKSNGIVTKSVKAVTDELGNMFDAIGLINTSDMSGIEQFASLFGLVSGNKAVDTVIIRRLKLIKELDKGLASLNEEQIFDISTQEDYIKSYGILNVSRDSALKKIEQQIDAINDLAKAEKIDAERKKGEADKIANAPATDAEKRVADQKAKRTKAEADKKIAAEIRFNEDLFKMTERSADEDAKFADETFEKIDEKFLIRKEFLDEQDFSERDLEINKKRERFEEDIKTLDENNVIDQDIKIGFETRLRDDIQDINDKADAKAEASAIKIENAERARRQARLMETTAMFEGLGSLMGAFAGLAEEGSNEAKVLTLTGIALDTASAISSLMAVSEANPLNAVTFGGAGIAQYATGLARIIASVASAKQAMDGFAEGVIDLEGAGTGTSDSIVARLSKGESVMTARETKSYKPLLQSIRDNRLDEYLNVSYRFKPDASSISAKDKESAFINALTHNLGAEGFNEDGIIDTMKRLDKNESKRMNDLAKIILQGYNKRPNLRRNA